MTTAAHPRIHTTNAAAWAGRVVSALVALFMTMDAVMHLSRPQPVVTAFPTIVPIIIGALAWGGLALRERLRA